MAGTKGDSIFVLLASNFLIVFGWALLTPLYALYATQLGASPQTVAFTWSFYTLLAGVLMIAPGWLEDRLPRKERMLSFGYTMQTIVAAHGLAALLSFATKGRPLSRRIRQYS